MDARKFSGADVDTGRLMVCHPPDTPGYDKEKRVRRPERHKKGKTR